MKRMLIVALMVGFFGVILLNATGKAGKKDETTIKLSTLEGVLRIHPKFLYKYYIVAYGGQTCALYGNARERELENLKNIKEGTKIRVRGQLDTFLHKGGSEENPSPFPKTWVIYMIPKEVIKLTEDSP